MIRAMKGWPLDGGETGTRQLLGKAVVFHKLFGDPMPPAIEGDYDKRQRYYYHLMVWDDYHRIFGDNVPMKRCATDRKEWDFNFEGVAHYGLLPDFLQDLSNVGLQSQDMSVLFRSAEHFAQMWVKTMRASDAINRPELRIYRRDASSHWVEWYAEPGDVLEATTTLGDPGSWQPYIGDYVEEGSFKRAVVPTGSRLAYRFFRVRKP